MEIKNACNILFAKFSLNYRVLIYLFISMTIVIAISVSIIIPSFTAVFNSPETVDMFTSLRQELGDFLSGTATFRDFSGALTAFFNGMSNLFGSTNAPVVFWITFSIMCVLIRFVSSLCYPAITDILSNFMSSNMRYGFASNMLKNFKVSVIYAFYHTFLSLAFDVIIVFSVIGLVRVFLPLINLFAFAIGLIAAVLLVAMRLSLSTGVVPEIIVGQESNYLKAIKKSWPWVKKYFSRLYGANVITVFAIYSLMAILTLPTFGVAFFVLAAVFVTFTQILQLVFYYGAHKMRYYTDSYTIVNTAPIEDRLDLQEELVSHDND